MSNIKDVSFNCESVGQAYIKLGETKFNEELSADHRILRIEVEISESYNDNVCAKSIEDILKDVKTPVIIFFNYLIDQKVKIFWRNYESSAFEKLDFTDCNEKVVSDFLHNFLAQEIANNNSGILKSFRDKKKLNIQDIGSQDGRNLLLIACKNNNLNVVEKLLELNFDVDYEDDDNFIAIEIAWDNFVKNESNKVQRDISENILMTLLSANSMFPRKISDRKCKIDTKFKYSKSELIKQFLYKNVELHAIVQKMHENEYEFDELIEKINEIRENHKAMRKFYNKDNKSLMLTAFDSENVAVRDKLIELGVSIGQHEITSFAEACSEKEENGNYWELDSFHKKSRLHSFNYPKSHLQILLARSQINYNDQNPSDHWKIIKEAYETIDQDEKCSLILQVAATRNKLHILFDFVNYTACYANPVACIESNGTTDDSGRITIGAKNLLLGGDTRNEVLGVIIHEFCHATMLVVYMNNSNPFQMGNSPLKEYFEKYVTKECEMNQNEENELIGVVFTAYSEEDRSVELITRPPHIWMHYLNNSDKIQLCEKKFSRLCKYFNKLVIPEMKNYLKLHPKLRNEDYKIEFDELTDPMKAKIANTELEFKGTTNSIHGIIDDKIEEYDILENLKSKQIKDWIIHNKPIEFEQNIKQEEQIASIERELIPFNTEQLKRGSTSEKILDSFILADEAGSGKTETMKLMATNFKIELRNFWISFISLKKHQSKIRAIREDDIDNENKNKSAKNMIKNILDLELDIEAKIFDHLLERGRVILLLDGYDEVCSGSNEFKIDVFKTLQANGNKISISTRPHYKDILKTHLNVEILKLKPLVWEQTVEIIRRVHSAAEAEDKKTINDVLKELKTLLEIIKQKQEFSNPLLISILAELLSANRINLKEVNLNIYKIFEEMTLMLEDRIKGKVNSHESSSFIHNNFTNREVHQVLALKLTLYYSNIKNLKIMKRWKQVRHEWSVDRIQRFGLVKLDKEFENDPQPKYINFIHKRYEEFFLAQYLTSLVMDPLNFDETDFQSIVQVFSYPSSLDYLDYKFIIGKIECDKNKVAENKNARNKLKSEANKLKVRILKGDVDFYENLLNALKFILVFISDDINFLKKFWNVDIGQYILSLFLREKAWNLSEIIKILNIYFGQNWNECFKFGIKKISFVEFLDENFGTEEEKQEQLGIIKVLEIVENYFSLKQKKTFYEVYSGELQRIINVENLKKIVIKIIVENSTDEEYFKFYYNYLLRIQDLKRWFNQKSTVKYIPEVFNILLQFKDKRLDFQNYFKSNEIEIKFDNIPDDCLKQLQKFVKEIDELYDFDIIDYLKFENFNVNDYFSIEHKINNFVSEFRENLKAKIIEKILFSILDFWLDSSKNRMKNIEFIMKYVESVNDSLNLNNLYDKMQKVLIARKFEYSFIACITDKNYNTVKNFIDFVFQNNPEKFKKFLTENYYVGTFVIKDEENLKNFKNIVNHYSINITECNVKEQILRFSSDFMNLIENNFEYYEIFKKLNEQDKCEIYSKLREKIPFNIIIKSLLSDTKKEKFKILVAFTKNVFNSSDILFENTKTKNDSFCEILCAKSNVNLVGDFLAQLFENKELLQQAKQEIIFSGFCDDTAITYYDQSTIFLNNFRYALSKCQPPYQFNETKMKDKLKATFNFGSKKGYNIFKEILTELFQDKKVDCSYFIGFNDSYSLDKIELMETFFYDFCKNDQISINKHMSEILMPDYTEPFYNDLFNNIIERECHELDIYHGMYPLIVAFFLKNLIQLKRITRFYKTYVDTWKWVQELFLKEFPFDSIPKMDEESFDELLDFLKIIFTNEREILKNHIHEKYDEEILNNLDNENCKKIIKAFNFNTEDNDVDMKDESSTKTTKN